MKQLRTYSVFLVILGAFQLFSPNITAQEIDKVVVTEEGDSIVTYKQNYYDFGALNQGTISLSELMADDSPLALGKDMDALRLEAFNRDVRRLRSLAPQVLSLSSGDGVDENRSVVKIPVQEGTTPTGARTYSVPITVAPAISLTPQIALVYNSQSGHGIAGYGWNISGLSEISIVNKTEYYNGEAKQVNYNDTDPAYSLDGLPLVQNSKSGLKDEFQLETSRGNI